MGDNDKAKFVEELKKRIFNWVNGVCDLCESLPKNSTTRVVNYQLIKSATSTGANHRAASRARSQKEFFAKISITVEESDESLYWLNIINARHYKGINQTELNKLIKEADEITRILAKARYNTGKSMNNQ